MLIELYWTKMRRRSISFLLSFSLLLASSGNVLSYEIFRDSAQEDLYEICTNNLVITKQTPFYEDGNAAFLSVCNTHRNDFISVQHNNIHNVQLAEKQYFPEKPVNAENAIPGKFLPRAPPENFQ